MPERPDREQYTLTIRDVARPGDAPPAVRLRLLLKRALRSFAFRCVGVAQTKGVGDEQLRADDEQRPA
ncbi:MAG: hypothetical protein U0797_12870 [Gemmataceae bacterium]